MNANLLVRFTLLIAALTLTALSSALAAGRAPALRYQFKSPVTNIYSVQIEMQNEDDTDILAGNLTVIGQSISSNTLSLTVRGSLSPRRNPSTSPATYRPFRGPSRWPSPISLNEPCEIQFDPSGRVLRISGDYPLSIPFGSIAQLFIESFPARAENRWSVAENLTIMDDPLNLGPANSFVLSPYGASYYSGSFMSRNAQGALSVTRNTRYEVKSSTPELVTLTKQMDLASRLLFGNEPRTSATATGEVAFDLNGVLQRAQLQTKTIANSDTLTRRSAGSLQIKLLKGEELEAALKPPPAQPGQISPTKKLTTEEIQKLMDDLKSSDTAARSVAASKLHFANLTNAPAGLVDLMVTFVSDNDPSLRNAAVRIIADYGTAEQLPVLLKFLKDSENSNNDTAIRGLGRLKDKRAAEPLAAVIASGRSEAGLAAEALIKIGPDAEDAVLALLKEKHRDTRRQACNILKQIGTAKSLEPLQELAFDPDRTVSEAAAEAGRAIRARQ